MRLRHSAEHESLWFMVGTLANDENFMADEHLPF